MARKPTQSKQGGERKGSGRKALDPMEKKYSVTMFIPLKYINDVNEIDNPSKLKYYKDAIANTRNKLAEKGIL